MGNFSYFFFLACGAVPKCQFFLGLYPGRLLVQIPCLSEEEQHLIPLAVIATGVPCQETAPELTFKL